MLAQQRMTRMIQDNDELNALARDTHGVIRAISAGNSSPPERYSVEMFLRSVVDVKDGQPVFRDIFRFDVNLSNYPDNRPVVRVADNGTVPFHPHFEPRIPFISAIIPTLSCWQDYEPYRKCGLRDYLLKIAHSLQYNAAFINCNSYSNKDALLWYVSAKDRQPDMFPTDKRLLPPVSETLPSMPSDPIKAPQGEPKKFVIVDQKPAHLPENKIRPAFTILAGLSSLTSSHCSTTHELYLTSKAVRQISQHIHWGEKSFKNGVEQGGILLGKVYRDEAAGVTYGLAEEAVAGELGRGSGVYLELDHSAWQQMYQQVDSLLERRGKGDMYIIGWYHTHPNSLDVFMSGTDRGTQERMFNKDWQFAIVLNPQRKIWKAFHGASARECRGEICKNLSTLTTSECFKLNH